MLGAVFSFRGRINRLQYFASICGLGLAALLIAALVLAISIGSGGGGADRLAMLTHLGLALILLLLVILPLYLWISFSLQARRLRDIGWEPVFVIPAWIGLGILDRIAVLGAPQIAVVHGSGESWLGLALNLGLTGCLLFWPGKPPFDVASVFDDAPPPNQPAPRQAAPVRPAMAMRAANSAPAGFGRRGL